MIIIEKLKQYLKHNYLVSVGEISLELGYSEEEAKKLLEKLWQENTLEKLDDDIYCVEGEIIDGFKLISLQYDVVFSHETALYFHDLTDMMVHYYVVTMSESAMNANKIPFRDDMEVHVVSDELFELGKSEMKSPFSHKVPVYDMERTICDIVKNKEHMDIQVFIDGIKWYFDEKDKDLHKLILYSRQLDIEDKVRTYVEVLA